MRLLPVAISMVSMPLFDSDDVSGERRMSASSRAACMKMAGSAVKPRSRLRQVRTCRPILGLIMAAIFFFDSGRCVFSLLLLLLLLTGPVEYRLHIGPCSGRQWVRHLAVQNDAPMRFCERQCGQRVRVRCGPCVGLCRTVRCSSQSVHRHDRAAGASLERTKRRPSLESRRHERHCWCR